MLCDAAKNLERGGAGAFLIASNTMHLVYEQVRASVGIPGLNIFDATAAAIHAKGLKGVGLLGTRYTMNLSFFREEYVRRGIEVIVPPSKDAVRVNEVIFRELIHNQVKPESQNMISGVIAALGESGALPLFDTTAIHSHAAVEWLLSSPGKGAEAEKS